MIGLNPLSSLVVVVLLLVSASSLSSAAGLSNNASNLFRTRNNDSRMVQRTITQTRIPPYESIPRSRLARNDYRHSKFERRNSFDESSTFNPEVLNKFLEEYASKMKSTTENSYKYPFTILKHQHESPSIEGHHSHAGSSFSPGNRNFSTVNMSIDSIFSSDQNRKDGPSNDTSERNKQWSNSNSNSNSPYDDRNGWVTLEAIPWSKSKISKWQANQAPQRPEWPEHKPWDQSHSDEKPWLERPSSYDEEKPPWHEKPKPHYQDDRYPSQKPWYQDRPKPSKPSRPSYYEDNDFPEKPNYAQKWPPEKIWDRYSDSTKTSPDIITDDRPSDFPRDRPQGSRPSYNVDRYQEDHREHTHNEWKSPSYDFPDKYHETNKRPSNFPKPADSQSRPHFSEYQYSTDHPATHPANGDGQWVLLSTNRGYSKSRQRSINFGSSNANLHPTEQTRRDGPEPTVAVLASRRQVRLTVLPSLNGTNTTTSHGGLLEVEKTFKTVDQSQKEYEKEKLATVPSATVNKPIRNTITKQPSNSAVLAAVGAGMLPATMAMVIPMMLGRKKRSYANDDVVDKQIRSSVFELNEDFIDLPRNQRNLKRLRL